MIVNFFFKEIINIGYLFFFQIYCAWSTTQALDYVYLLFWNAFWTVAAVIAIGIFDRNVDDRVLMEVPELYARSRKGNYFGMRLFLIYMLDGLWQSAVLYFFYAYTYDTTTARTDGFDIQLYEWSTAMAIGSVLIANLFTGLDARAWTWWMVVGIFLGPVLIFIFAPIYAAFGPNTIWSYSFGNNYYLYRSAYFWFLGPLCAIACLLPRFLWKTYRVNYRPTDIDIIRMVHKNDNKHDFVRDPYMPGRRAAEAYGIALPPPGGHARQSSTASADGLPETHPLQPISSRASSTHYDMLTGEARPNRGYSFSQEDVSSRPEKSKKTQRRKSIRDRLLPGTIRRTLQRRGDQKRLSTVQQREEDEQLAERDDLEQTTEGDSSYKPFSSSDPVEEEVTEAQPVASSSALQPTPAAVSGGSVPETSASQATLSYYTASVRSRTHTADMSYATAEDHTDGNTETDASVRNSHSRGPSVS